MGLDDFLSPEEKLGDHYDQFLKLKAKLEKEGLPENIATYKASCILTPAKLEKVHLLPNEHKTIGYRASLNFFFDNEKDLELVAKYFNVSFSQKAVKSAKLLIDLLKLMEDL